MKLRLDTPSEIRPGVIYPAGTVVTLLESVGPSAWLVEVRIKDPTLIGGASYDTVEVRSRDLVPAPPTLPPEACRHGTTVGFICTHCNEERRTSFLAPLIVLAPILATIACLRWC